MRSHADAASRSAGRAWAGGRTLVLKSREIFPTLRTDGRTARRGRRHAEQGTGTGVSDCGGGGGACSNVAGSPSPSSSSVVRSVFVRRGAASSSSSGGISHELFSESS